MCMKCTGEANPERKEVDSWLPGAGWRGYEQWLIMGTGFWFAFLKW